jgi:hypothetical protein
VSSACPEVAFGLTPYLHRFALARGAAPFWKWDQEGITQQPVVPRNMHRAFAEVARKALLGQIARIHFNLDGIRDPLASAESAAQALARQQAAGLPVDWSVVGLTNAELHAIRSEPGLLQRTTFYRNGTPVPLPF